MDKQKCHEHDLPRQQSQQATSEIRTRLPVSFAVTPKDLVLLREVKVDDAAAFPGAHFGAPS